MRKVSRGVFLMVLAWALTARPASAGFVSGSISPTGTTGPGGTITYSQITPGDPTSAYLNTDYTGTGPIPFDFSVTDRSPVAIYGNAVNNTTMTWTSFTVSVASGNATFLDPNNPLDQYGTYSDQNGWTVTLLDNGSTAVFSGGLIVPAIRSTPFWVCRRHRHPSASN